MLNGRPCLKFPVVLQRGENANSPAKRVSRGLAREAHPVALSLRQNAVVALVLAPFLPFSPPAPHGAGDWIALAALGVVASALSHQFYFFALRRLPAVLCGAFISLEPIYAILMAAALFTQPIGPAVGASAALIVAASLLLLWRSPPAWAP